MNALTRLLRRLTAKMRSSDGKTAPPDRAIAKRVQETFEQDLDATDVRGLHFYVRDGTVTMYGTVEHDLDRDLLVTCARQIDGVREVISHLHSTDDPA